MEPYRHWFYHLHVWEHFAQVQLWFQTSGYLATWCACWRGVSSWPKSQFSVQFLSSGPRRNGIMGDLAVALRDFWMFHMKISAVVILLRGTWRDMRQFIHLFHAMNMGVVWLNYWLVVWNIFVFSRYWELMIPTDYFSEGLKPPTSLTTISKGTSMSGMDLEGVNISLDFGFSASPYKSTRSCMV